MDKSKVVHIQDSHLVNGGIETVMEYQMKNIESFIGDLLNELIRSDMRIEMMKSTLSAFEIFIHALSTHPSEMTVWRRGDKASEIALGELRNFLKSLGIKRHMSHFKNVQDRLIFDYLDGFFMKTALLHDSPNSAKVNHDDMKQLRKEKDYSVNVLSGIHGLETLLSDYCFAVDFDKRGRGILLEIKTFLVIFRNREVPLLNGDKHNSNLFESYKRSMAELNEYMIEDRIERMWEKMGRFRFE